MARKYDHEYKVQAVKLAKEIGGAKAAKELGIPEGTIHTWLKAVRAGTLDIGDGAHTPESAMSLAEELAMLRKRVKDIDTHIGLMHTLFALEDMYGLKVKNVDGQPHLCLDSSISAPGSSVDEMLRSWMEHADKLENGEISKEEYNEWRYKYPELDTYQKRAKVPSQELSDYLVKELTKKEK